MGSFYVTQSNPAHHLVDPTQPNPNGILKSQPNQTKPNQTKPNQTKPNQTHMIVCMLSFFQKLKGQFYCRPISNLISVSTTLMCGQFDFHF